MIIIKRYCQDVDLYDVLFVERCIYAYLHGKWGRRDVQRFFSKFSSIPEGEVTFLCLKENRHELYGIITEIAEYMISCMRRRSLNLRPIKYHTIIDGMTQKERVIGVQHPLHQMYDYVAVEAMKPMLLAKIGVFQCASLPGRGQAYGKKHLERWVREEKTVYYAKGDITKCFPSISSTRIKELIARDVKNEDVCWLVGDLIDRFEGGLSIGSYLSQYLCNYYLSYAYHYASEKLFKTRKSKKGGEKRVRLINHVLFYMDDFLLTGSSKKDLRKAMNLLIAYIREFLQLEVKPGWKVSRISETEPIDMMGFVFRKNRTTIRARIFLKTRRRFLRAAKLLKKKRSIPLNLAYRCVSAFGWYKNTNSFQVIERLQMNKIVTLCKSIISLHAKIERSEKDAAIAQARAARASRGVPAS